jgi:hypothetical protein
MKKYLLIISLFVFALSACGGEDQADATAAESSQEPSASIVEKPEQAVQGEVRADGIEGFWQAADQSRWLLKEGSLKKIAASGVEMSEESYEMADASPCTKESEGPYLVVKGRVQTCFKVMVLDTDSLHLQLSKARPLKKFARL